MALTYWPLGLVLLVGLVAGAVWWWRTSGPPTATGLAVANTDNVRRTPHFTALAKNLVRWSTVQVVALLLMVGGCWLLASRFGLADEQSAEQRNRDIMLCLDVSGSMKAIDADMMKAFAEITGQLKGERIGLTIWDSSAVMKFPLTNDYDYIAEQLKDGAEMITGRDAYRWMQGTYAGKGSSIVGDGIMSCLDRFDKRDTDRARTMILATDNHLSGEPLYTMAEAIDEAKAAKVVVFAIGPTDDKDFRELRLKAEDTGGAGFLLKSVGSGPEIVRSVQAQEARRLEGPKRKLVTDLSPVGLTLIGLGVAGWAAASTRLRES